MKKKIIGFIAVLIVIGIFYGGYIAFKKITTPKKVHFHAGFVVFKNDLKLNFSDFKYMSIEPCSLTKNHEDLDEDIQREKAHLHDNVGDVIHVERSGGTWRDLFTNIHYAIDYSNVKVYRDGKEVINFQNQKIQPDESIVILIGNNKSNHLDDAVSKSYIEEKAAKSIDCGD